MHYLLFSRRPQRPSGGESPAPEELLRPALKGKTYYAVTVGRKPGVYDDWYVHVCLGSPRNFTYNDFVQDGYQGANGRSCTVSEEIYDVGRCCK
jgi:hypothetical protein